MIMAGTIFGGKGRNNSDLRSQSSDFFFLYKGGGGACPPFKPCFHFAFLGLKKDSQQNEPKGIPRQSQPQMEPHPSGVLFEKQRACFEI